MEIEKLIERLHNHDGVWCSIPTGAKLIADAATTLEQLQAENEKLKAQVPRWIPVEERLPEVEGTYIVYVDGEVKWDAYCVCGEIERWLCYDGSPTPFYIDPYSSEPTREPPYPSVSHWMPLPQAPKGEKE